MWPCQMPIYLEKFHLFLSNIFHFHLLLQFLKIVFPKQGLIIISPHTKIWQPMLETRQEQKRRKLS